MTPKHKKRPRDARSRGSRMSGLRGSRLTRRVAAITTAAVLALALCGLGVWMILVRMPELTLQSYPVEYEEQIRRYAAQNNIPPAYVAAVILAESSYDSEAVSYADARGLMQLLPSTAAWVADNLGEGAEADFDGTCLFDPETNIRYGSWYLGYLMQLFNGDMTCATAAYHAGQGRVKQWLDDPRYSPDGETLAVIPSDATAPYVAKVLKYYEKYESLYAQDA